jgi:hypothetical protein
MTTKPNLTGAVVLLRNPEPRDVADRLALGLDPTIVHLFGVDPDASGTIPALSPLTVTTVEQWMDAIAKGPHSWVIEHEGRFLGDVHLRANAVDRLAARAELAISLYDTTIGRAASAWCVVTSEDDPSRPYGPARVKRIKLAHLTEMR